MSNSEGQQQSTEKDEVSQPVAELTRQILSFALKKALA